MALGTRQIGPPQIGDERPHRLTVGGDVMQYDDEDVVVGVDSTVTDREQANTQRQFGGDVEGGVTDECGRVGELPRSRDVLPPQAGPGLVDRQDMLPRFTARRREHGPQDLVAVQQVDDGGA